MAEFEYGRAVRVIRAMRGMTQRETAERAEIEPNYLAMIESGGRTPSARLQRAIARALHAPPYFVTMLADAGEVRRMSAEMRGELARQLLDLYLAGSGD